MAALKNPRRNPLFVSQSHMLIKSPRFLGCSCNLSPIVTCSFFPPSTPQTTTHSLTDDLSASAGLPSPIDSLLELTKQVNK